MRFILVLLVILLSMAVFRSPAVALMPDVTIKPLRSKANAIINLMGSFGGMIILGVGMFFATSSIKNYFMHYMPYVLAVSFVMIISV